MLLRGSSSLYQHRPFLLLLRGRLNMTLKASVSTKILNLETLNRGVREAQYAVRGELAIKSETLHQQLESGGAKLPFKSITSCNIGNPQQLGQKPITFFRQVAALTEYPELLNSPQLGFPKDAVDRAQTLLKHIGPSIGAYSQSQGIPYIRKKVAEFIQQRDGFPSSPNNIFLTQGASAGVQMILNCLVQHEKVGVMIPIPQYPLYSATLTLYHGRQVPYFLNEEDEWSMLLPDLTNALKKARNEGTDVRALVIINPGNPTGQCLSKERMQQVIEFCHKERIMLLADEVYQTNVYEPDARPFHSFKKVLREMGPAYDEFELVSFHSVSKGMIGECGRRGGYFECTGFDQIVLDQIYKLCSIMLCPNVPGQIMVELMINPPKPGEPSFEKYENEIKSLYTSLKRRSRTLADAFNGLEGVTCNQAQGSMYLFPRIRLPKRAIEAAEAQGKQADTFYCLKMLEATGVCVVPGSGFGQQDGTWHFRSTFLPPEDSFDEFIGNIRRFHQDFMNAYRD